VDWVERLVSSALRESDSTVSPTETTAWPVSALTARSWLPASAITLASSATWETISRRLATIVETAVPRTSRSERGLTSTVRSPWETASAAVAISRR